MVVKHSLSHLNSCRIYFGTYRKLKKMSEKTNEKIEKERMFRRNYGDYLTEYPSFFDKKNETEFNEPSDESAEEPNNKIKRWAQAFLLIAIIFGGKILYHRLQEYFYYTLSNAVGFYSAAISVPLAIVASAVVATFIFLFLKNKIPGLKKIFEKLDGTIIYLAVAFFLISIPITFIFRTELFPDKIVKYGFPNRIEKSVQIADSRQIELTIKKEKHTSKSHSYYTYHLGLIFVFDDESFAFYEFKNYDTILEILEDYKDSIPIRVSHSEYFWDFMNKNRKNLSQKNYTALKNYFNNK